MNVKKPMGKLPKYFEDNPIGGSIISKMTASRSTRPIDPRQSNLSSIGLATNEKIKNNDTIVQLFPDIELCIQILTSSIISPNDMTTNELNYVSPDIKLPGELRQLLLTTIENHIEKYYSLNSKLPTILREALFTKGSYIEAIIPEASLDDVISQYNYKGNISIEDFKNMDFNKFLDSSLNFLGVDTNNNKYNVSTEDIAYIYNNSKANTQTQLVEVTQEDLGITITDNYKLLNLSSIKLDYSRKMANERLHPKLNHEEDNQEDEEADIDLDSFFRPVTDYKQLDIVEFKTAEDASRKSFGRPLTFKLPSESVIPVHVTNDPSKHLGYFVMVDQNGSPINTDSAVTDDGIMKQTFFTANDQKLGLIEKASSALLNITKDDVKLDNLEELYSKLVENMLKDKLKRGLYGDLVDIKDNADVYRVMLYRALRAQQTRILFLPAELVTFYAFDYRENGTGKSLMEKAATLYSIRSIVLFSRIMAYIKNSTTVTNITANIDEHEKDPAAIMDKVMSEALKTRQTALPLGITRVDDLVDWTHRVGMKFKFTHPGLPDYDISVEDTNTNKVVPDEELDNSIREYIIMSFGLTPEIVEAGYNQDYATTVVAKNLLLAKRVTQTQNLFVPQVSNHIRKILANDMSLQEDLRNILKSNLPEVRKVFKKAKNEDDEKIKKLKDKKLIEYILDIYIKEISVELPKPEVYEANNIKNAFQDYKSVLDDTMDVIFSTEALPEELVGSISGKIDIIKGVMKSALLKKWLTDNNYLTELSDFIARDDEDKPVFNILAEHDIFINALSESLLPYIKDRYKSKVKVDNKLQKIEDAVNDSGSDDYDSDDSGDEDDNYENDTGDEGADGGNGDSDDMDDDFGSDDSSDDNDNSNGDDDMGDMDMDMGDGEEGDGDAEGSEGGSDGGEDDGLGDMGDMDDPFGDSGSSKKSSSGPRQPTEAEENLTKAKIETEKARAEKAKMDAELQKAKIAQIQKESGIELNDGTIQESTTDSTDDTSTTDTRDSSVTADTDNTNTNSKDIGDLDSETQDDDSDDTATDEGQADATDNTEREAKPEGTEEMGNIDDAMNSESREGFRHRKFKMFI